MARKKRKLLGRYIVADPEICHGKPTFIGTRIMAFQVLRQLAHGMDWHEITEAWGGKVSKEAIIEAIELARRAFEDHAVEYATTERLPAPTGIAFFAMHLHQEQQLSWE